ncbi:hypothetical protein FH608_019470 [Nonomuraea phyllanthi]|uniref:Uncharacterized protein n=1 Tax=Nonomuraea phyllanthi TaxID=2219224 RepID=A0A5C4WEG7_9ACTN|nr:hypothetical protein [Nonomuraea phyllanthi]KAB8193427.1 hypothetical protein FH608_019470 [Nonomuraea phyllanthi]QFY12171.1 hypothetical protein GBF35_41355 [Nonomuraea phyllanthi]
MIKRLAGTVLVAAAATSVLAAPAGASASTSTSTTAAAAASAQLIRTKVYFGRCKDTCRIKVRVRNVSYKNLYNVKLNASLKVNGRKAGTCYDYIGTIRARKTRWASCTVRTRTLDRMYNNWLDGYASFNRYAHTNVSYRYYR